MALEAVKPALAALPYLPMIRFSIATKSIFNKEAYEWQRGVANRLLLDDERNAPHALLVVRPTGGASVCYEISVVSCSAASH
jgi:hypothetical protein